MLGGMTRSGRVFVLACCLVRERVLCGALHPHPNPRLRWGQGVFPGRGGRELQYPHPSPLPEGEGALWQDWRLGGLLDSCFRRNGEKMGRPLGNEEALSCRLGLLLLSSLWLWLRSLCRRSCRSRLWRLRDRLGSSSGLWRDAGIPCRASSLEGASGLMLS